MPTLHQNPARATRWVRLLNRNCLLILTMLSLSFFVLLPGHARISGGNQVSPDQRFRIESLDEEEKFVLLDKSGNRLLSFDTPNASRGVNIFWSPNSQYLVIAAQWKWGVALFAAEMVGSEWQMARLPEYSQDIEERAKPLLNRKAGPAWTLQSDYFDRLDWLNNDTFEYKTAVMFGNGKSPKDEEEDRADFDCTLTMKFEPGHVTISNVKLVPNMRPSEAPAIANPSKQIESDPRYAPQDARLNQVYAALRSKLSPAKREKLRLMERDFLDRREHFRGDPDRFFSVTEEQIALLRQMLQAAKTFN